MPSATAALATRAPMAPRPITPSRLAACSLRADKRGLALFHQPWPRPRWPCRVLAHSTAGNHLAAARNQQAGDDQLCHGVGVGARGVEHHDAGFRCIRPRGCCWRLHPRGRWPAGCPADRHIVHSGGLRTRMPVAVDRSSVDRRTGWLGSWASAAGRDRIQRFDVSYISYVSFPGPVSDGHRVLYQIGRRCFPGERGQSVVLVGTSRMKSTSLSTPSAGMAL